MMSTTRWFWKEKDAYLAVGKAYQRYLEGIRISVYKARDTRRHKSCEKNIQNFARCKEKGNFVYAKTNLDGRSYRDVVISVKDAARSVAIRDRYEEMGVVFEQSKDSVLGVGDDPVSDERMAIGKLKNIAVNSDIESENIGVNGDDESDIVKSLSILTSKPMEVLDMEVEIPQKDMEWIEKFVIGSLNKNVTFAQVKETVVALNLNALVIPSSNVRVLLQFNSIEETQSFLDHPGELMEVCCSKFRCWDDSGEESLSEAWIKLEGVPLFLWHQNFFIELSSRWEGAGDRNFSNDDEFLKDDCSCSGEKPLDISLVALVNKVVVSGDLVEVVLEMAQGGDNIDIPDNRIHDTLEVEPNVSIGVSGQLIFKALVCTRSADAIQDGSVDVIQNGHSNDLEVQPYKGGKRKKLLMRIFEEGKQTQTDQLSGTSLTDNNIKNRNKILREEAEAIWEISSTLGVFFNKDKQVVLSALMDQEGVRA
ncbi:hypothetical protein COLO4_29363 [Corchorus olitorius]|uniref:DUF4283 domain-containing protein n=1 Tax=Corchorus olitorius TaxID=93759 RepID=A0A1R3HEZ6_9ROSI|nr:hypothetical protein COLO4_29363 [Corchorus olitorius]